MKVALTLAAASLPDIDCRAGISPVKAIAKQRNMPIASCRGEDFDCFAVRIDVFCGVPSGRSEESAADVA